MEPHSTYVINIIGGPGSGKTVMAALLFAEFKINGIVTEYVPEYAKRLVWREKFETLNNQHQVSTEQYKLFKSMIGKVKFIITDGSLLHGLYYNKTNPDNTSDVIRTHRKILEYYNNFKNINIFLTRGTFDYEQAGRIQNESEAQQIDIELKKILRDEKISYVEFKSGKEHVKTIMNHIDSMFVSSEPI
jgi:nicotinamide riboside kinase